MFLSVQEIKEMSGCSSHANQINWLRKNGIRHLVGVDGKPKVLRAHVEQVLGLKEPANRRMREPNFAAVNC